MKKKLKYILLVTVLLIVAIGGYTLYVFKFKDYDVADTAIDEIVKENYVIELPDGTQLEIDNKGKIIENTVENETKVETNEKQISNNITGQTPQKQVNIEQSKGELTSSLKNSPSSGQVQQNTKPTVASIKEKYVPVFEGLEVQATSRLNGLISNAKYEYSAKKASGEKISYAYFYNKYLGAAEGLETNIDAVFNSLLSIVESDLKANGFDTSNTQSIRDEYEATKSARRDGLLSKVLGSF